MANYSGAPSYSEDNFIFYLTLFSQTENDKGEAEIVSETSLRSWKHILINKFIPIGSFMKSKIRRRW